VWLMALEYPHRDLTGRIIGAAIEVHRLLGPGLLESAYRQCLSRELALASIPFRLEVPIPLIYKGLNLDCGFRADIVVQDSVLLELKACEHLLPVHEAQVLTYLKLCDLRIGLLVNFNATSLRHGIRRLAR
jgi:GxxExxY protein